jgi:hypothetical protein
MAESAAHLVLLDQRDDLRCQINNFLLLARFNSERVHDLTLVRRERRDGARLSERPALPGIATGVA